MNIEQLKGIGPKSAQLLRKVGITTITDLLTYYPYKYLQINIKKLNDCLENETVYVEGEIGSVPKASFIRRNLNFLSFVCHIDGKNVNVRIFNRAFLKPNLTLGKHIVLVGKYTPIKNTFIASDIKFNVVNNTIEAKYHLISGLKESLLVKAIKSALELNYNLPDYVPKEFNDAYALIGKNAAIKYIHEPHSMTEIKQAKLKLIYEELFDYTFKINALKIKNRQANGLKKVFDTEKVSDFLSDLPFKLTEDQNQTINEILADEKGASRMNRLVLGDVGSGKTIVALAGILANYLSGYQTAFMAPTEILAKQHYESIKNYFTNQGLNIALLTGNMTKKEKEQLYEALKTQKIDLVIGTHALINDQVKFAKLGLVIIDEQHLFGVKQRNALQEKGAIGPDVLYLSATPIPRSYALCLYGDLDLSMIKTKPQMRKEIMTLVKKETEIKDVLLKMLAEIKGGHQVFVVSPLIDENEEGNLNSVLKLKEKLNLAFKEQVPIEIIHGKMKQAEKDQIMQDFLAQKIKILISTTVIEVGIDIPNATMMIIFNAERFGLAALHQLRGRVGRSDLQSYCYLISNTDNDRLKVMEASTDGFYIAEKDFEQRGQGDLFGVKQSGDISFKIANIRQDSKILLQASKDSEKFLMEHKYLEDKHYQEILKEIDFLD